MIFLWDAVIIIFMFFLFGYSHSLLASNKVKRKVVKKAGDKIAFYRLFYNAVSVITFVLIYELSPKPGIVIYDLNYPWDIVIFVLQFFSLMGFIWAASAVNLMEFLGFEQIKRQMNGNYNPDELDERYELKKTGAFKYSRHPIYFFSILFIGLRPTMSFFYLVFFVCITAYFIVGSLYEEKKLEEIFGQNYTEYKREVPWLIPYKFFNR